MSFYRTRDFIRFDYSPRGVHFDRVDQNTDLGFLFVPSLDFLPHIDYIVSKSVCDLGFIRRHSSLVSILLTVIFRTLLCISTFNIRVWSYCLGSILHRRFTYG